MTAGQPEQRHVIERRVRGDRRSGLDRRIAARRVEFRWVEVERRALADRRARERRGPVPRRSWLDRRGSGLTFSDLTLA